MDGLSGTVAPKQHVAAEGPTAWVRKEPAFPPSMVMIGASTGGPQALIELLADLGPALPYISVCVTLHMPPELMSVIAAHVTRKCGCPAHVVTERVRLENGIVHFAPGDRYMEFARSGTSLDVTPTHGAPRDFCKPAIDTMFASGAAIQGSRALGVVLSGMGTDGLVGARAITAAGGIVLVQDKGTSAVWGMPGAVAKANLAAAVLAPSAIAKEVIRRIQPGRRLR